MENLFLESMIEKIIHSLQTLEGTVVEKDKSYDVSMRDWAWPQGVALFAMYQYYATKRDPALLKYLEDWFAEHFEAGLPPVDVNNTCPMLTLTYLYEETGNPEYKKHLDKWCDEIIAHFPRTEEGGFTHYIVTLPNEGQLWDDTLYMTVLFLARMGQLRKEPALQQESIRQFLVHIKYLTDTRTGLLFHGWDFNGRHNFAQARYYARGSVLVEKEALPWAEKPLHEAIYTAKAADVVVLCLGLSPLLEGEEGDAYNGADSGDRKDISLPDIQQQLLCAILDTEKPVVLVNVSGGCVDLRQADERCAAILQCFYPGAEGGNALADILFGRVSPSGRLPVTFYRTVEDLPPFTDYSMKGRTYRFFDGKPLYPFGHGLTYADIKEQWTDPYTVRVKNASETATGYSILRYENRALADFKHIWLDGHTETEVRFLQENENKRQTRSAHSCKEK